MKVEAYEFQNEQKKLMVTLLSEDHLPESWVLMSRTSINHEELFQGMMMRTAELSSGATRTVRMQGEFRLQIQEKKLEFLQGQRTETIVFPGDHGQENSMMIESGIFEFDALSAGTITIQGKEIEPLPFILKHTRHPQLSFNLNAEMIFSWIEERSNLWFIWSANVPSTDQAYGVHCGIARARRVKFTPSSDKLLFEISQISYEGQYQLNSYPQSLIHLISGKKIQEYYDHQKQALIIDSKIGFFDAEGELTSNGFYPETVTEMSSSALKNGLNEIQTRYRGRFENGWLMDGVVELYDAPRPQLYFGKFKTTVCEETQRRQSIYHDDRGRHYQSLGPSRYQMRVGFQEGSHQVDIESGKTEFYDVVLQNGQLHSIIKLEYDSDHDNVQQVWHLCCSQGVFMMMNIHTKKATAAESPDKKRDVVVKIKVNPEVQRFFEQVNRDLMVLNLVSEPKPEQPVHAKHSRVTPATRQLPNVAVNEEEALAMQSELLEEDDREKKIKKDQARLKNLQQRQEKEKKQREIWAREQHELIHLEHDQRHEQVALREISTRGSLHDRFFREIRAMEQKNIMGEAWQDRGSMRLDELKERQNIYLKHDESLETRERESLLGQLKHTFATLPQREKTYTHPQWDELGQLLGWYELPLNRPSSNFGRDGHGRRDYVHWQVLPRWANLNEIPQYGFDLKFVYTQRISSIQKDSVVKLIAPAAPHHPTHRMGVSIYSPHHRRLIQILINSSASLFGEHWRFAKVERTEFQISVDGRVTPMAQERWVGLMKINVHAQEYALGRLFEISSGYYFDLTRDATRQHRIQQGVRDLNYTWINSEAANERYPFEDPQDFVEMMRSVNPSEVAKNLGARY
jgi:hypothetical protein